MKISLHFSRCGNSETTELSRKKYEGKSFNNDNKMLSFIYLANKCLSKISLHVLDMEIVKSHTCTIKGKALKMLTKC